MKRMHFGKNKKGKEDLNALVPLKRFDIDNLFRNFFAEPFDSGIFDMSGFMAPAIDIYEKGDKVIVKADLPGMDKKNIKLHLEDNVLTISGETRREKEHRSKDCYCCERSFGRFERSIRLPEGIKAEEMSASHEDGVLTIEVPRAEKTKDSARDIEVK